MGGKIEACGSVNFASQNACQLLAYVLPFGYQASGYSLGGNACLL